MIRREYHIAPGLLQDFREVFQQLEKYPMVEAASALERFTPQVEALRAEIYPVKINKFSQVDRSVLHEIIEICRKLVVVTVNNAGKEIKERQDAMRFRSRATNNQMLADYLRLTKIGLALSRVAERFARELGLAKKNLETMEILRQEIEDLHRQYFNMQKKRQKEDAERKKEQESGGGTAKNQAPQKAAIKQRRGKEPYGFAAVAGMKELKQAIEVDIIGALKNRKRYEEYGLTIPNGMLLYGPPGSGKTFFAEKLAEEIGFKFFSVKPSDIQSPYVNGSQKKVGELFAAAKEEAPSIIFFDELDAVVPSRDTAHLHQENKNLVNELLIQMNNLGKQNIFVIGATNRREAIDPAILRRGRLDKHFYVATPDKEAREGIFQLYLQRRPICNDLDYAALAEASETLVPSDIKFITDEAARTALHRDMKICQAIVLEILEKYYPSL